MAIEWWATPLHQSFSKLRKRGPPTRASTFSDGRSYEVAMVEPEFGFAARLAELIDEAQDPAKAVGRPLSDEEIIDLLEETTLTLRMEFLKPGGSRRR